MSYSNCQANSKAPAFVTKVPHDVVLTQTDTRIFVKNIKTGVTLDQFKNAMEKYGPVQVYLYEHGSKDNGWAWVGFEDKETAEKAVRDYECGEEAEITEKKPEESNAAPNDNAQNEDEEEEKQETDSFYAEAEEQNESEANENDESVKEEESDEEAD